MLRSYFRRLSATLGLLVASGILPNLVQAQAVITKFTGTATDIGLPRGPGQVGGVEFRVHGSFVYTGSLNLPTSTATFHELLAELGQGGRGELIKMTDEVSFLPMTLLPRSTGKTNEAVYDSPKQFRPQIRFQVNKRYPAAGIYEFAFRLDRGLARKQPLLCAIDPKDGRSKTWMTFSFEINDGVNPPLTLSTTQPWECALGGFQMRRQ